MTPAGRAASGDLGIMAEIPEFIVDLVAAVGFHAEADRITNASKRQRHLVGDRPRYLRRFNVKGRSRFHYAACMGNAARVQYWLDNGADPVDHSLAPFLDACSFGRAVVVQLLLINCRVDPSANDNAAIRVSSANGHAAVVQLLLADTRADPAALCNEAIRLASANGHTAVVQLLLADPAVNPTARNNEAIREASERGRIAVVQLLMDNSRVGPSACPIDLLDVCAVLVHLAVAALFLPDYPHVHASRSVFGEVVNFLCFFFHVMDCTF